VNYISNGNVQYAIHVLWLEDEAFIVEKVELEMYQDIIIINDKTCPIRYFIYSKRNHILNHRLTPLSTLPHQGGALKAVEKCGRKFVNLYFIELVESS